MAGTPTSLAAVEMELEPYDSERVHGHLLTLPAIQRLLSRLASVPLEERRRIPGLHPDRAPTIVAGVVILIETMRAFGLDEVRVSEHDILYGVAIDASSRAAPVNRRYPIGQRTAGRQARSSKWPHRTPKTW